MEKKINIAELPKTYEECCKILNIPVNGDIVYAGNWTDGGEYLDKHLDMLRKFQQLLICRDAYWKIAEDWEFTFCDNVYYLCNVYGNIQEFNGIVDCNTIIAFPTEEMYNNFYKNFEDLIEQCKELL